MGDVYVLDPATGRVASSAEDSARAEEVFLQAEAASMAWLDRMILQGNREQLGRGVRVVARLAGKSGRAFEQLLGATHAGEALVRGTAAYWARSVEGSQERMQRIRTRLGEMLLDRDANVRASAAGTLRAMESKG